MPPARKRAVPACCEAAERPETVASQAPKKAPGGRNLHRA